ncbi:hypothetical protein niasHT_027717 [Heterodera trifolii]|uniref:Uncharacterized protein n=1 Tax=Heterodera trifolii TaxID=157864 RepID=A0ABD2ISY0_9BILA
MNAQFPALLMLAIVLMFCVLLFSTICEAAPKKNKEKKEEIHFVDEANFRGFVQQKTGRPADVQTTSDTSASLNAWLPPADQEEGGTASSATSKSAKKE